MCFKRDLEYQSVKKCLIDRAGVCVPRRIEVDGHVRGIDGPLMGKRGVALSEIRNTRITSYLATVGVQVRVATQF